MEKTNDRGYSFEVDLGLTEYAHQENYKGDYIEHGLSKDVVVLKITKEDKVYGYILFDTARQEALTKEMSFEQTACKIDIMKFLHSI